MIKTKVHIMSKYVGYRNYVEASHCSNFLVDDQEQILIMQMKVDNDLLKKKKKRQKKLIYLKSLIAQFHHWKVYYARLHLQSNT